MMMPQAEHSAAWACRWPHLGQVHLVAGGACRFVSTRGEAVIVGVDQAQAGARLRLLAGLGPGAVQDREVLVGLAFRQIALDGDSVATE